MALIRNGLSLSANPARLSGGPNLYTVNRSGWTQPGRMRGFYAGEGTVIDGASIADTSARPNGYEAPYAWLLAPRGGGLSTYTSIVHPSTLTAGLSLGINIDSPMASVGSVTTANIRAIANLLATLLSSTTTLAELDAYANLIAALVSDGDLDVDLDFYANLTSALLATGALSTAQLSLVVSMVCPMTSNGVLSTAQLSLVITFSCAMLSQCAMTAELRTRANLAASLVAAGDLEGSVSVLAGMVATMTSVGDVDGSMRGILTMAAEITTAGDTGDAPPSPSQIAAAVWDYLLGSVTAAESLARTTPTTSGEVLASVSNTAASFLTDLTEAAPNHWKDALVSFSSGALLGQVKRVSAYDGTTKVLTVAGGFTSPPAAGSTFVLVNR